MAITYCPKSIRRFVKKLHMKYTYTQIEIHEKVPFYAQK